MSHFGPINNGTTHIRYKVLVLVFMCNHNKAPQYVQELIVSKRSMYRLRNQSAPWLYVPSVKHTTLGGRAFARVGPLWWNKICVVQCLPQFLKCLKNSFV